MTQREQLLVNALISLSQTTEYLAGIIERNTTVEVIRPNDIRLLGECKKLNKIAAKNWEEFNNRDVLKVEAMELSLNTN